MKIETRKIEQTGQQNDWNALRRGDKSALKRLFQVHYKLLYGYGLKFCQDEEIVKDCIQDLFLKLWSRHQNLPKIESIRPYLVVGLKNRLIEVLRRKNRITVQDEVYAANRPDSADFSIEDIIIARESRDAKLKQILNYINSIAPRKREAFYLRSFAELPYREIAEIMNISSQVARNYVSEVYEKLRSNLT